MFTFFGVLPYFNSWRIPDKRLQWKSFFIFEWAKRREIKKIATESAVSSEMRLGKAQENFGRDGPKKIRFKQMKRIL